MLGGRLRQGSGKQFSEPHCPLQTGGCISRAASEPSGPQLQASVSDSASDSASDSVSDSVSVRATHTFSEHDCDCVGLLLSDKCFATSHRLLLCCRQSPLQTEETCQPFWEVFAQQWTDCSLSVSVMSSQLRPIGSASPERRLIRACAVITDHK